MQFSQDQLQAIAEALADTDEGLTGTEIAHMLASCQIADVDPQNTKWKRLYNAFANEQNARGDRSRILGFIRKSMKPARFARKQDRFEPMRANLNRALAFTGLAVDASGALSSSQKASTLGEAEKRARELRADLLSRGVHPDVLAFCREELVQDNYFHAVLEAVKSVANKLRNRTGLLDDGAVLADRAFGGDTPMLAINPLRTKSEQDEQKGFVNLLKGTFGMFRNPTAHEAKVNWAMSKEDAGREDRLARRRPRRSPLGTPGCGKTMFASALAVTCDVPLVVGSLARWQAKGHLGDLLREMRSAFAEAARSAPSILFIDELDSFGDREAFDRTSNNAQYCREVVNGFLECLDGAGGREGVVVVGATNFPDAIDAAIRRPGRLDRHIVIPLPDLQAREGILLFHPGNGPEQVACRGVAARTEGWTGARLEQLARDAKRRARRERRQVTETDMAACLPELVALPPELRRRAAVHEAGHAVAGLVLGRELAEVRIADSIETGSGTQSGGGTRFRESGPGVRTRQYLLDGIAVVLAGLAAEEIILGARSSGGGGQPGSDLHEATLAALTVEAAYGLGQGLTYLSGTSEAELLATLHMNVMLQGRVEKLIAGEFERAKGLVQEHERFIRHVSNAFLTHGRIEGVVLAATLRARQPPAA